MVSMLRSRWARVTCTLGALAVLLYTVGAPVYAT
jgi:hypothetical protein